MTVCVRVATVVLALRLVCGAQSSSAALPSNSGAPPAPVQPISAEAAGDATIVPGGLKHQVEPNYPKEAWQAGIGGTVVLRATIDEKGKVKDLAILGGEIFLAEEAVDAVRSWKFKPFTQNGRPVAVQQKIRITFSPEKHRGELDPQLPAPKLVPKAGDPDPDIAVNSGTFHIGHGVTAPKVTYDPEPQYTEKARREKYQGTCLVSLIVGPDGVPHSFKVIHALGMGLDMSALRTVQTWRFQPATKDGKPVEVFATVEVNFHLY